MVACRWNCRVRCGVAPLLLLPHGSYDPERQRYRPPRDPHYYTALVPRAASVKIPSIMRSEERRELLAMLARESYFERQLTLSIELVFGYSPECECKL